MSKPSLFSRFFFKFYPFITNYLNLTKSKKKTLFFIFTKKINHQKPNIKQRWAARPDRSPVWSAGGNPLRSWRHQCSDRSWRHRGWLWRHPSWIWRRPRRWSGFWRNRCNAASCESVWWKIYILLFFSGVWIIVLYITCWEINKLFLRFVRKTLQLQSETSWFWTILSWNFS